MIASRHIKYLLLMLIAASGCIEPFDPDISRYEEVLVVEGSFSDLPGDHYVRLSTTMQYSDATPGMVTGAAVAIRDSDGNVATCREIEDGVYLLDSGLMEGVVGKSYQLIVETIDGNRYESAYEMLKKAVDIDSVYYEIESNIPGSPGNQGNGLQIYVDAEDPGGETGYYRWDWVETWEFTVPYYKPGFTNKVKCWTIRPSSGISIESTIQLEKDIVYRHKLNFVSGSSNRLVRQYSLLVRQFSLSEEAYDFWRKLELANEHTGTLFDPPPTPVTGNLENVNDPLEPVLGYFEVSGVSEKRIFISHDELPANFRVATGNEHCEALEVMGDGQQELSRGWLLLFRYEFMDTLWTRMSNRMDCYDCTLKGENVRPDYWIDAEE
jgi:hypothetical protein